MFDRRSFSRPLIFAAAVVALSAGSAFAAGQPPEKQIAIADLPELGEQTVEVATPSTAVAARLGLDTPVSKLCADPRAKAVLDSDLPGLTTRPEYVFFKHMSLKRLQAMSRGRMTDADLAKVDAELQRISVASNDLGDN